MRLFPPSSLPRRRESRTGFADVGQRRLDSRLRGNEIVENEGLVLVAALSTMLRMVPLPATRGKNLTAG